MPKRSIHAQRTRFARRSLLLPLLAVVAAALPGARALSADDDIIFTAALSDEDQSIPTYSPGKGFAEVRLERATLKITWNVTYQGLTSPAIEKCYEMCYLRTPFEFSRSDIPDKWIKENEEFAARGAGLPREELKARILQRLEPVGKAYEEFIKAHPNHSRARVAYASFLGDTRGEEAAQEQLEKALAIDPNNPAIYNNLGNIFGHIGPVTNAFACYEKAIKLNPLEPVYYHNFGTTVYLFRKDVREYYGLSEEQVFAKAFGLYSNAMRLDPDNLPLASDVAQSYYGVKPLPVEDALKAWTNALSLAHDEIEPNLSCPRPERYRDSSTMKNNLKNSEG